MLYEKCEGGVVDGSVMIVDDNGFNRWIDRIAIGLGGMGGVAGGNSKTG